MVTNYKKIYVLFGGGGFIGTNIYNRLMDKDSYFMIFDNKNCSLNFGLKNEIVANKSILEMPDLPGLIDTHYSIDKVELSTTKISYLQSLERQIRNDINKIYVDIRRNNTVVPIKLYFVHLGSTVGVFNNTNSNFDRDVRMTQNIIWLLNRLIFGIENWIKRFRKIEVLYASTSELFGEINKEKESFLDQEICFNNIDLSCLYSPEDHERSHYMYQKFIGEQLFRGFQVKFLQSDIVNEIDIDTRILRFFNLVGPYQDPTKGVFSKFIVHIFDCALKNQYNRILKSKAVRRYIPINVIVPIFESIDNSCAGNTRRDNVNCFPRDYEENNYMFSNEVYLTCNGEQLYDFLYNAILKLFPGIELAKMEPNNNPYSLVEIQNRFESNYDSYTLDKFIEVYGSTIMDTIKYLRFTHKINFADKYKSMIQHYLDFYSLKGLVYIEQEKPIEPVIIKPEHNYSIQSINTEYGLVTIKLNDFGGYTNENIGNLVNFENGGTGLVSGLKLDPITNYYYYEVVILGKMYKDANKKESLYHVGMGCDMGEKLILPEREINGEVVHNAK